MRRTFISSRTIVTRCSLASVLLLVLVSHAGAAYRVQRPIASGILDQEYKYGEPYTPLGLDPHKGLDWPYPAGTPVYAIASGTVVGLYEGYEAGQGTGWGNYVLLRHDRRHYDRQSSSWAHVYSIYMHLKKNSVRPTEGARVSEGTWIAEVDSTGNSTGNHLHLQIVLHPLADRTKDTLDSENRSRNPELWLSPYGGTTGTVVGRLANSNGDPMGSYNILGLAKQWATYSARWWASRFS